MDGEKLGVWVLGYNNNVLVTVCLFCSLILHGLSFAVSRAVCLVRLPFLPSNLDTKYGKLHWRQRQRLRVVELGRCGETMSAVCIHLLTASVAEWKLRNVRDIVMIM